MKFRWFKRYSVATQPNRMGAPRRILMQEKVLQVFEDGSWQDIPTINDSEGYEAANRALKAKSPFKMDDRLEELEAEINDFTQEADNE